MPTYEKSRLSSAVYLGDEKRLQTTVIISERSVPRILSSSRSREKEW